LKFIHAGSLETIVEGHLLLSTDSSDTPKHCFGITAPPVIARKYAENMAAVIYVRQSLDRDGEGSAVARQLAECRDHAERRKLEVVHEYVDNDVSA
jgi:hypothetical protein